MRGKPVVLDDFSGGVDFLNDPRELAVNVASDLSNVVPGANGKSIKSRPGLNTLYATTYDVEHIVRAENPGTYMLSASDGRLYRAGVSVLHTPGTAPAGRGWSISRGYSVAGGGLRWLFMHPQTAAQVWFDGDPATVAWATSGGLPTLSRAIHERANRIWAIKGDTLYWSDIADIDSWPTANRATPVPGELLWAIGDCGPYIVLFAGTHIIFVYDFDTGANRVVTSRRGINQDPINGNLQSRAFVSTDDGVFFHDGQDYVYLSSSEQFTRIGDPVKPLGRPTNPTMGYDGRFLYVRHDAARVLMYDTALKSWWLQTFATGAITADSLGMALGPSAAGAVASWAPLGSIAPSPAITAYWEKAGLDFDENRRKRLRTLQVIGDSQIDTVTVRPDNQSLLTRTPSFDSYGEARLHSLGVGREFTVKILGFDTAQWEMNRLVFWLSGRQD